MTDQELTKVKAEIFTRKLYKDSPQEVRRQIGKYLHPDRKFRFFDQPEDFYDN